MFLVGGAFVGVFIFAVMSALHPRVERPPGVDVLVVLIIAGSLGGIVYRLAENQFQKMSRQPA